MGDNKSIIIQFFITLVIIVFCARLAYLQLVDDVYKEKANTNALLRVIDYPYRGLVWDRKGRLIVNNVPVFDIMVTPREVKRGMDTLGFCYLFGISKEEFDSKMETAKNYNRRKPSPFIRQIGYDEAGRIAERIIDYPGFTMIPRSVRSYERPTFANAMGYIGEISKSKLDAQGKNGYYKIGDYIGISGLEKQYEEVLRGKRGVKFVMVDVHGAHKGSFKNGEFDTASVAGKDLYSTIDLDLQAYGEKLMVGKAGSVVALEPSTGEILAFVSTPTYDPNLLSGRNYGKNYKMLERDPTKPLFNRALMAMYPPGSIFKTLQALIAMEEGVADSNTTFPCVQNIVKCHAHPNPCNLRQAIQWSCNPYFLSLYRKIINQDKSTNTFIDSRIGYERWLEHIRTFGVGVRLGVDIPSEQPGILRSVKYFNKLYGEKQWKYSNIRSISIGQGELGVLPLQMANFAAIIANRGHYYTPHFVRKVGEDGKTDTAFTNKRVSSVKPKYFDVIREGMKMAVNQGTVMSTARLKGVDICGKTGTAQNPHGKDHSIFICFAPKENPKIAIAAVVENGGFGGFMAAPIATLMIEKYLNDTITRPHVEKYVLEREYLSLRFPHLARKKVSNEQ